SLVPLPRCAGARSLHLLRSGGGIRHPRSSRAWSLRQLAVVLGLRGELGQAFALLEQAAARFPELGAAPRVAVVTHDQGLSAMRLGDYSHARSLLEESLAQALDLGFAQGASGVTAELGTLGLYERRCDDACSLFAVALRGLAACFAAEGELEPAGRMVG